MVVIEFRSCGRWQRPRFGIMSPSYAAAMIANLKEKDYTARTVPA